MPELEAKIDAWRATLAAALPNQEETIRELESHLRDHIETLRRQGAGEDEAFAASVQRLGEVHGLAREFDRVRSPWLPSSWPERGVLGLLAIFVAAIAVLIARKLSAGTMTPLLATHVLFLTAGYLTVFATGLVGACALVKTWRAQLGPGERRELRDLVFRLTIVGSVLVPVGIGLGMIWAAENRGTAWSWARLEVGALCVLVSTVLLLLTQLKPGVSANLRWLGAVLGGAVVVFGMVCGAALTPAVPIGWLWLALVASQGAVLRLRSVKKRMEVVE